MISSIPFDINIGPASEIKVVIAPGRAFIRLPNIGIKLSNKNVPVLDINVDNVPCTSPSVVNAARKLVAAAFIAPIEPVNVVDASAAAVPVIPKSCWIT